MVFPTHIVSAGGIVEDVGWVYPGGIVEVGENLMDGLVREIKEESGIDATVSHLITVVSNTGIHKFYDGITDVPTKVMFDFVCKPVGGELAISDETTDSRWVQKENVLNCITDSAIRIRYEAYLGFNGSAIYREYDTPLKSECNVKLARHV